MLDIVLSIMLYSIVLRADSCGLIIAIHSTKKLNQNTRKKLSKMKTKTFVACHISGMALCLCAAACAFLLPYWWGLGVLCAGALTSLTAAFTLLFKYQIQNEKTK